MAQVRNNVILWIRLLKGLTVLSLCMMIGCGATAGDAVDESFSSQAQALDSNCDADQDGQLSLACGGGDCDDHSPTTFAGAVEVCDGVDNDCDQTIDEQCVDSFAPDPCTKISCRWP